MGIAFGYVWLGKVRLGYADFLLRFGYNKSCDEKFCVYLSGSMHIIKWVDPGEFSGFPEQKPYDGSIFRLLRNSNQIFCCISDLLT